MGEGGASESASGIRRIMGIPMRRCQHNPILTGEPGGKVMVDGLAPRIAGGDVPPALEGVPMWVLDIELLQAGPA